jgi:hypothetical protein
LSKEAVVAYTEQSHNVIGGPTGNIKYLSVAGNRAFEPYTIIDEYYFSVVMGNIERIYREIYTNK